MFIEIKGVQFVNKGAELMLASVVDRVKQYWPEAEIVLQGNKLSPYKKRALLGAYQKLSLRKNIIDLNFLSYWLPKSFRNQLKKWGIVTEVDIDVVLDAAGFAYGDQWGAMAVKHLGGELKRYKKSGCKYIFLPQALGPFSRVADQRVLKKSLPSAALICAREKDSYKHVRAVIGDADNLVQFPDFTNAVDGIVPDYWVEGKTKVCFIPNSNMIGARNSNESWKKNYITIMTLLISQVIKKGYKPILLNHEGKGDREICSILNSHFGHTLELIEESEPLKIKGIIGASKAIVCSRFHGCVSSLSQGVVNLGTSWSHKYEELYSEYGVSNLLIDPNGSEEALIELINSLLSPEQPFVEQINDNAAKYKKITETMWASVVELINEPK
jgi:polysaccharide pyruvyl transferase WcaK-like protein